MRFFKEAFENISVNHGTDSVASLFMRDKRNAEKAQAESDLLDEPVTLSGAPTSFLKSRRMSAKKKTMNNSETQSIASLH